MDSVTSSLTETEISGTTPFLFKRKLSLPDLTYACSGSRVVDRYQIVNECVIEGEGIIPEEKLRAAIERVAHAIPACRMVIKKRWGLKEWHGDGPLPSLRTVHEAWDGRSSENLGFLERPLDLFKGPIAEIIQVISDKTFLVFRVHHAAMDGVGLSDFVRNVFRALNDKPLENYHSTFVLEDLVRDTQKAGSVPSERVVALNPLGAPPADGVSQFARTWQRISAPGNDFMVLPKIMLILSKIARKHGAGRVCFRIPVSLRRHIPEQKTSANLIGVLVMDINEQDTLRSVVRRFNQKLAENVELPRAQSKKTLFISRWTPMVLLRLLAKVMFYFQLKQTYYLYSGTLSSVGLADLNDYCCDGFSAKALFGIPILSQTTPLFVAVCGTQSTTEITVSSSRSWAEGGRLTALCQELKEQLERIQ